jgi:multidrug transporter EmrE-like cation transporter
MNTVLMVAAGVIATAADWLLKSWSVHGKTWQLPVALLVYVVATMLFAFSLKTGTILGNGTVYAVINGLGVVAISRLVFRENLSAMQYAGVGLAVAGLALIELA